MRPAHRFLLASGLPITPRQFWCYGLLYWGLFSLIRYCQSMLVWFISRGGRLYATDFFYWLLELLFWWGATPVVIFFARRFSLLRTRGLAGLAGQVLLHLCLAACLYALELLLQHLLLGAAMAAEQGRAASIRNLAMVFSLSFGTAFSQYMLLVAVYNVLMYVYRFQSLKEKHLQAELANEQLRSQLANAQLQSLKMQLNPHFLFNTLHTVVSLMLRNQTRRAALMVTTLSDLLRNVLARQQANFLALRDEITLTRHYLSIQQIRFEDRLTIEYGIAPEAEDCPVPQLILQPLVENAITHGIADMTEGALIRVTARRQGDDLTIEVYDNGLGRHQLHDTSGTGLGLANTVSRLEKAYGNKAQLLFAQPPGGTTTVQIRIYCPERPLDTDTQTHTT